MSVDLGILNGSVCLSGTSLNIELQILLTYMMSFPGQEENLSKNQGPVSRELSLSEWRHWQHKSLPTHVVDHSLRCHHFIKVMELIDGMREENEVRADVFIL